MENIGLQAYTIRSYTESDISCENALRQVKDLGYSCLQLAGSPEVMKRCLKYCEKLDLPVIGILSGYATCKEHSEELLQMLTSCGGSDLGMSNMTMVPQQMLEFIDFTNALALRAAERGITVSYHNHSTEFVKGEDQKTLMDLLIEKTDPGHVFFMPDVYWLQYAGIDVRHMIGTLGSRIGIVHLKDMKFTPKGPDFAPIGQGNMNMPGIIETALNHGVHRFVVEQDWYEGDSMEAVRISMEYLKNL